MGNKISPTPSDYRSAATQQASAQNANLAQQTQANRPNINGTLSSQQWVQGPNGQWTLNAGLGQAQGLGTTLLGQAQQANASPLDDGTSTYNQALDRVWQGATSRLDPLWQRQEAAQATQLANQGLDPSSEAARAANLQLGQQRNDAYNQAYAQAQGLAGNLAAQTFQQNMQARNNPLAQLFALNSAGSQTPQFNQAGLAQAPDILGATMAQDAANRQQQQDIINTFFRIGDMGLRTVDTMGNVAGRFMGGG